MHPALVNDQSIHSNAKERKEGRQSHLGLICQKAKWESVDHDKK